VPPARRTGTTFAKRSDYSVPSPKIAGPKSAVLPAPDVKLADPVYVRFVHLPRRWRRRMRSAVFVPLTAINEAKKALRHIALGRARLPSR